MKFLFIPLLILLAASCNKSGGGAFQNLEDEPIETNDPSINGPVVISAVTPSTNPVTLVAGLNTFALQIDAGAGDNVTFDFRLDGISVQNSTSPFYVLTGAGVIAGAHTLEVVAENPTYSDTHTFNLFKNTPPVLTLVNTNPANPGIISCIGGTFIMNTSATDADGDPITFSFYVNEVTGSPTLVNSSTASTASTTFTPTCAMVGNANVKIRATDTSGEYDEELVAVTVSNPAQASITGFSPTASPVIIQSTDTQQFIISPDGTAPYTVVWTLTPGGVVAACANQTSCSFNGGGAYVGSYTLNVSLSDNNATSDSMDFNLIFNAPPAFTASSYILTTSGTPGTPSTAAALNFNCADSVQFSTTVNDQNFGDAGQTHSIVWTYGGTAITDPSIDQMFSVSTNVASNPMTSTLTFTPACDSAALQGTKELKMVVSDGLEEAQDTWNIYTSYLSTYCLNLTAGQICTLAGKPGLGSGLHTVNDAANIRIRPGRMIQGPAAGTYFISDAVNGIVWFYNSNAAGSYDFKSCTTSTCSAGTGPFTTTSVGPKRIVALVGTGVPGLGSVGQIATNFYLNTPAGLGWDNTNKVLYISDYTNNRVLKVLFDAASTSNVLGKPQIFAGGTCTAIGSCATSNVAGVTAVTATGHKCTGPVDLVLDGTSLYTACYGNPANEYTLKKFDTSTLIGTNYILNNAAITEGAMNGTAKSPGIYAMIKHPTEDALIISTPASACNIFVANISGAPTFYGAAVGGDVTPAANTMMRLTRNTTACNTTSTAGFRWDTAAATLRAYSLYPRVRGAVVEGFYFTNNPNNHVGFLNITNATTVTIGGVAVAPGFYARVWGNGTAGAVRTATNANAVAALNAPIGAFETATHLLVSDNSNFMISTLDTYVNNGATGDVFTSVNPGGFDGDGDVPPTTTRLNDPFSLHYSALENKLYISDVLNARIRSIDLNIGTVKTEISNGASIAAANLTADNLLPNANGIVTPRDLFFVEDQSTLLYASSGSNSHHVRAYNKNISGADTIVGTSVNAGRLTTVVGRNNVAATNWVQGTMNGQIGTLAPVAFNNIWGVVGKPDGSLLRMANYSNNCIIKTDSSGLVTQEIGICGAATNYPAAGPITSYDGPIATAAFYNPREMEIDPDYSVNGNFFVTDGVLGNGNLNGYMNGLRYVNFHPTDYVTITDPAGNPISIGPNEVGTIVSGLNTFINGVAVYDNWICYSQGAYTIVFSGAEQNVTCFDRSGALPKVTIGKNLSTIKGGIQLDKEQEGIAASSATLAEPAGLAFDGDGNLYIAERRTHSIRMVKRWW